MADPIRTKDQIPTHRKRLTLRRFGHLGLLGEDDRSPAYAHLRAQIEQDLIQVVFGRYNKKDVMFSADELAYCNHIHEGINPEWVKEILDGLVEEGELKKGDMVPESDPEASPQEFYWVVRGRRERRVEMSIAQKDSGLA